MDSSGCWFSLVPEETLEGICFYLDACDIGRVAQLRFATHLLKKETFWSEVWRLDFEEKSGCRFLDMIQSPEVLLPRKAVRVSSWPGAFVGAGCDVRAEGLGLFRVSHLTRDKRNACARSMRPFGVRRDPVAVPTAGQNDAVAWRATRTAYFECELVGDEAAGNSACVAVGLCHGDFDVGGNKMPGWDSASYGFHSDDGLRFHGSGFGGSAFGPTSNRGDVVGAGLFVGASSQFVFYTRNGRCLGMQRAERPPPQERRRLPREKRPTDEATFIFDNSYYYPVVGLDDPDLSVRINLGFSQPLAFDVAANEAALDDLAAELDDLRRTTRASLRSTVSRLLLSS
mmetsp:Transcript_30820/g.99372  ORF Transcript_30820/g.99372 Transcript_30820/m.99372 type:complete len:342 (+) Transcript_30820:932-1957(+)